MMMKQQMMKKFRNKILTQTQTYHENRECSHAHVNSLILQTLLSVSVSL